MPRQLVFEPSFEASFDQDFFRRKLRHKFVCIIGIAFGGQEFAGTDIQKGYTQGLVAPMMYGCQEVVELAVQYVVAQRYAGRHQLGDAALDKGLGCLGIFELLANSYALAGAHQLGKIGIQGVMRKSRQFDVCRRAVGTTCQGDAQYFGSGQSVVAESLVEVTYAKQQYRIGMLAFHLDVLLHQRRFGYFFGHDMVVFLYSGGQKDGVYVSVP